MNIVILLFLALGCNNEKSTGDLQFAYYPQKNVYYDPAKKIFFYSLDGAKSWAQFKSSDSGDVNALGEKKVIYSSDTNVYNANKKHRELYSGKLYAIAAMDSEETDSSDEVTEINNTVQKKRIVPKKQVSTKPKSGIGKFINKIFGKK